MKHMTQNRVINLVVNALGQYFDITLVNMKDI